MSQDTKNRGGITWKSEGSTGEYRPEPAEIEVPRVAGAGLVGLNQAPLMDRHEHLLAVKSGDIGSVHSWELVTAVDGPGTRLTIFLAGCPLRCVYCHNPDTLKMKDGTAVFASDLIQLMSKYIPVFNATKGGVTFSGGEAMMQPAFLNKLLRGAKERGIHTTLDTSGFLGAIASDQMIDDLDLVLLDVKSGNPEIYKKLTGRPLAPTISFGKRLAERGKKMWVRFVDVPGWTNDPDNVAKTADIVAAWGDAVERVEVLPFHQMARDKWANLGLEYQLEDVEPPEKEETAAVREIFRSRGLLVF